MTSTGAATDSTERSPEVPGDVQQAFAELGRIMLDQPLGQFLHRVADVAAATLPGVDSLSITLVEGGQARSAAFTSAIAAALDERQYEDGFGPCLDAAQSGETIRVHPGADAGVDPAADAEADPGADPEADAGSGGSGYAAFAAAARRHGVVEVASVGMPVPQRVVGALNLYSLSVRVEDDTLDLARTFASYAAVALANAALYSSTALLASQLQEAMRSRAVIEQAKGVVMAQLRLDADQAFAHLTKESQHSNTKLRDVAVGIVARAQEGRQEGRTG